MKNSAFILLFFVSGIFFSTCTSCNDRGNGKADGPTNDTIAQLQKKIDSLEKLILPNSDNLKGSLSILFDSVNPPKKFDSVLQIIRFNRASLQAILDDSFDYTGFNKRSSQRTGTSYVDTNKHFFLVAVPDRNGIDTLYVVSPSYNDRMSPNYLCGTCCPTVCSAKN